jgi:predicted Zn-dependent peptidase
VARTAVVAGTASVVAGNVHHRQQQKWAAQEQQQAQQQYEQEMAQQAAVAPPPVAQADYMAELEQLSQLKNQGVITEEEFEAKKKQLLGI